jgi:hypothetical protein
MAANHPTPEGDFRSIPTHPGYFVDEGGQVWSCRVHGRIASALRLLKPYPINESGHLAVRLGDGSGNTTSRLVHHLVLEAFTGPCPPGLQARHLDGNPANNRPGNLVWGTQSENEQDKVRHGTDNRGERSWRAKLTEETVHLIRALIARGVQKRRIAAGLRVSVSAVEYVGTGGRWGHVPVREMTDAEVVALSQKWSIDLPGS